MGLLLPYPAATALDAGIAVKFSANTVVVATSSAAAMFVTTAPCASGAIPDLADVGDEVWVTTSGTVNATDLVTATTAGAFVAVVPTGAAAAWTAGVCLRTAENNRALILYNPAYYAANS